MTFQPDRRRLLGALLGTGGLVLTASVVSPPALVARSMPLRDALLAVLSHPDGARSIGSEYLTKFPTEGGVARLLHLIAQHDPRALRSRMTGAEARAFLQAGVRQDFRDQRTVELNGWVISRTEARLCALATLA